MLKSFGDAALELFEILGGFALESGFAVGIVLAADAVVGKRELEMAGGAIGSEFFVGFERRNGFGELLVSHEGGAQAKVGFRKTRVDLCGARVMADGGAEIIVFGK